MTQRNDGGPAFARSANFDEDGPAAFDHDGQEGMSLRDYFAAKAMQAIVSRGPNVWSDVALDAYEIADAMLAEREKRDGQA